MHQMVIITTGKFQSIRMTETRNAIMQIARTTSNEAEEERRATDAFMMAIETVNGIMDRVSYIGTYFNSFT